MNTHIFASRYVIRHVFSLFVVNARTQKGLSQSQLAQRLGMTLRWIQFVEKGTNMPSFYLAVNLILTLEIDVAALLEQIQKEMKEERQHGEISSHPDA